MSTAVLSELAKGQRPSVFTLCPGESFPLELEGLTEPLVISLKSNAREIAYGCMTINGKDMGPWLKQEVGPTPDTSPPVSYRLRKKTGYQMQRRDMLWSYTIPGAGIILLMSEVSKKNSFAVHFALKET